MAETCSACPRPAPPDRHLCQACHEGLSLNDAIIPIDHCDDCGWSLPECECSAEASS